MTFFKLQFEDSWGARKYFFINSDGVKVPISRKDKVKYRVKVKNTVFNLMVWAYEGVDYDHGHKYPWIGTALGIKTKIPQIGIKVDVGIDQILDAGIEVQIAVV